MGAVKLGLTIPEYMDKLTAASASANPQPEAPSRPVGSEPPKQALPKRDPIGRVKYTGVRATSTERRPR